jgi:hypothetical protein
MMNSSLAESSSKIFVRYLESRAAGVVQVSDAKHPAAYFKEQVIFPLHLFGSAGMCEAYCSECI